MRRGDDGEEGKSCLILSQYLFVYLLMIKNGG